MQTVAPAPPIMEISISEKVTFFHFGYLSFRERLEFLFCGLLCFNLSFNIVNLMNFKLPFTYVLNTSREI